MAGEKTPLTFFLPGFSKCGTTSAVELLDRHPQILFPADREPWFFGDPTYADHWSSLRSQFPVDLSPYRALGDDSTAYSSVTWAADVVPRLAAEFPQARYVFVVRDPVARIESAFREFHHSGPRYGINAPFMLSDAMRELPEIVADSCYAERLDVVRRHVPRGRLKIIFHEDLLDDPQAVVTSVYRFLALDPERDPPPSAMPALNVGERKRHDTALLRRMRADHPLGRSLARLSFRTQERILTPLRLRREFVTPVVWDPAAVAEVRHRVIPDAARFAAEYGVARRGWRRLAELAADVTPESAGDEPTVALPPTADEGP